MTSALITAAELSHNLPNVKILDASYGMPDARGGFERAHIKSAQYFDIDAVADMSAPYPHTLPSADDFGTAVGTMGVGNDDMVVVYDQTGISFAAARVWWMFRVMGHDHVRVLNGGLPAWAGAGLPVQSGPALVPAPKTFRAQFRGHLFRSFEQMEDNTDDTIIDARAAARFQAPARSADGDALPAHIPGSINLPFAALLDERGVMKDADVIAPVLLPHIAPGSPVVATCGSGVTACVLALGFYEAGLHDVAVYGGSWTEWADRNAIR